MYLGYNVFHVMQRCWAHILREAEFIMYDKIHQKMITIGGKIMFGSIMTCLLTWYKGAELV